MGYKQYEGVPRKYKKCNGQKVTPYYKGSGNKWYVKYRRGNDSSWYEGTEAKGSSPEEALEKSYKKLKKRL